MNLDKIIEIVKEFSAVPSVVEYEDGFRLFLHNKLKESNIESER